MLLWAFKATKMSAIVSLEKEPSSQIFSFKPHFWKFYAKQDRPHIHILKKIQSENTRKLIYVNISLWFIHFYLFKKELFKKWKKRFDRHAFILTICISFSGLYDRETQSEWLETTEIFVSWVWRPEIWNWVWAGPCSQEGSGQVLPAWYSFELQVLPTIFHLPRLVGRPLSESQGLLPMSSQVFPLCLSVSIYNFLLFVRTPVSLD